MTNANEKLRNSANIYAYSLRSLICRRKETAREAAASDRACDALKVAAREWAFGWRERRQLEAEAAVGRAYVSGEGFEAAMNALLALQEKPDGK